MKSLKGFVLKQLISAENEVKTEVHHPVKGNSMKIGSSFVCHLVFKGLNLVHFEISLNKNNQVEIRNNSQASPISVNGETVLDKRELTDGDNIEALGHEFVWERQSPPDALDEDLEASYQLDKPDQGRNSEPRIVNHKWVANSKRNQSIHIGEAEVSSTTENSDGEIAIEVEEEEGEQQENVADKENQRPSTETIPETEDDEESEHEKTILRELTEHSESAVLIDWNTPEAPQKSINFIDLNTPAPAKPETPVRTTTKTPMTATSLYKKVLNPRISIAYLESDFEQPLSGDQVQSTPMVDRSQGSSFQQSLTANTIVDLSDISDSDQSTIVSNSVVVTAAATAQDIDIPEAAIDELFEDAEELAKSDTNLQATVGENTLKVSGTDLVVEMDDEGEEFVPATQLCQLPTRELQLLSPEENEEVNADVLGRSTITDLEMIPEAINEDSPVLFDEREENEQEKPAEGEQIVEQVIEEETPSATESVESPDKEIKAKAFTPRKSMRTPKKVDKDRCCTPKSLSKVLLTEAAEQRRSPRVSRMNLSLRMEGTKVNTPIATRTPKNLSKSLMVSKLQSAKKSALKANKSVVEIPDSDSEQEEAEDQTEVVANETMNGKEEGVVLLADETIASRSQAMTPTLFNNTVNESDVIVIDSPFTPEVIAPEVKIEQPEPVINANVDEVEETQRNSIVGVENALEVSKEIQLAIESDSEEEKTAPVAEIVLESAEDVPLGAEANSPNATEIATADSSIPNCDVLVQEMYKSPMKSLRILSNDGENSPASLQKTPKGKELMTDEKVVRSPLQNVSNMVGVRELFKTPKPETEKNFTGLREMMKTPQTVMHVTSSVGIKELMKTPGRLFNNDVNMVGVKELLKTPKTSSELNLVGVKELVNTPMPQKEKNFTGLREMMQTPKTSNETHMLGVKELMNTPMATVHVNTVGVKELFNTPQVVRDPNMLGVRELLKTPAAPKGDVPLGLNEMLQTPKPGTSAATELAQGMEEFFKTPAPTKMAKVVEEDGEEVKELEISQEVIPEVDEENLEVDQPVEQVIAEPQDKAIEESVVDSVQAEEKEEVVEAIVAEEEDNSTTPSADEEGDQLAGQLNVEVVESVSMNTSAELFDKMMHRKSIKHTYSRKSTTPVKEDGKAKQQQETISPEKKEEVERWVESIIVSGSGQISAASTQKIVNNNLQVMSDRYSNVTPSQGQKAESLWRQPPNEKQEEQPQSKVEVANVKVSVDHVDEVAKEDDNEIAPTEEIVAPVDQSAEAEKEDEEAAEKPKRGRPRLIKDAAVVETPKTPLRTRRNLRADMEDTPSAVTTPRTRRAASLKLEESSREVKTTPARKGRKAKVADPDVLAEVVVPEEVDKPITVEQTQDATVDESPPEQEEEVAQEPEREEEVAQEPEKKRGRPKAVKKLISQTDEEQNNMTPQKRGRKAKAVEQLSTEAEVKVATPTRRGRKPAAAKTVETIEETASVVQQDVGEAEQEEIKKPESPVKRRGRGAKAVVVEQKTVDEKEEDPKGKEEEEKETPKPVGRGRGRRGAPQKVERSESDLTATESEDAPKAAVARGRKKKVVAEPEQKTQIVESDASTVEQKTEEEEEQQKSDGTAEKPKATRGKRVQIQLPTTDTDESPKKEEKAKRGRGAAQKRKVEVAASAEQKKSPEEAKSEEEKDKSDTEHVPAKKPARGRKAAVAQQEANDSVVSTPGKRRGRKPAAEKVDKETGELVAVSAPTRGRGKRAVAVVATDDVVDTPKRAKKQVSDDTEEREDEAEVEEKPKRRGRAKKETSVADEEVNVSTTTKGRGGRKAKTTTEPIKPVEESQSAESEKETTGDESMAPPSRGKRTATKRAAPANTTGEEESETTRPTRATRRKN